MAVIGTIIPIIGKAGAAMNKFEPAKTTTAGDLGELTFIKAASASDTVAGYTRYDYATGAEVELLGPGSVAIGRAASGGVTKDDYLKLDSGDVTELATFTIVGSGNTVVQCQGKALETAAENVNFRFVVMLTTERTT